MITSAIGFGTGRLEADAAAAAITRHVAARKKRCAIDRYRGCLARPFFLDRTALRRESCSLARMCSAWGCDIDIDVDPRPPASFALEKKSRRELELYLEAGRGSWKWELRMSPVRGISHVRWEGGNHYRCVCCMLSEMLEFLPQDPRGFEPGFTN